MGSLCIVSESENSEREEKTQEQIQLLEQQKYNKRDNAAINENDTNGDESDSTDNADFDAMQFDAMQQEVIILSTRNANLEQQLEEMKKKYNALMTKQSSASSQDEYDASPIVDVASQMVPIGYICDELNINSPDLAQQIEIEHLEELLSRIEENLNLNEKQLDFIKLVSDEIDDNLMGLLNILVKKPNHLVFDKCIIIEMVSFIYLEEDEEEENEYKEQYDIQIVCDICDQLKVPRDVVNEIDSMIKQRLGADSKFESLFIQNIHDQ